jgi:hypothetical protein
METENVQTPEYESEVISPVEDLSTEEMYSAEETLEEDEYTPPTKAEFKKLQRKAYAYEALKGNKTEAKAEVRQPATGDDKLKELELKIDGYSKDEIELVKEFGFDKLDNPIVQKAIDVMRKERKSKEADVSVSNKSLVYKKYTENDLKNLSVEELRKILPHANN